jgi:arylsulfatase A-like enzyme
VSACARREPKQLAMFRANRARGEGVPTTQSESQPTTTSVESLLALGLCAIVILASLALLRRSSHYSRALVELQLDTLHSRSHRPRAADPLAPAEPEVDLVILVALDSLRADHLGLYGYARETAPRLRRLGEEGMVFRTVSAQSSQTLLSQKSMLTGKYPATLMLEETGADLLELSSLADPGAYLASTFSSVQGRLASGFRSHGFRTAGFTDGPWAGRKAGFEPGFGAFDDDGGGLAAILPRALAWLENSAPSPAFVFVHAGDLACPYSAPEPFEHAFCMDHAVHGPLGERCEARTRVDLASADLTALSDHYDAAVLCADDLLGRFFDELRARGLYERALIVVTSSHGESLGERGVVGHGGLYLEQLLVPLIVKFPQAWNTTPATITESVELVDLLPTLFALCGIPAEKDLDGRSLLPILRGVRGRDYVVAQGSFEEAPELGSSPVKRTLLRPGRWQVMQDSAHSQASFFDLEKDPRGLSPHSIAAEELSFLLDVLLGRARPDPHAPRRQTAPPRFSPEIQQELEQLGYGAALSSGQGQASVLR